MNVFISYSRNNQVFVDRLAEDLEAQGIHVWVDRHDLQPGSPSWEMALREAIGQSDWVLLAASPDARQSFYVQDEILLAQSSQIPVIPIWVDGTHWVDSVPLGMGHAQYVDMRGNTYRDGLQRVVGTLKHEQPDDLIEAQVSLVPAPVRKGFIYGLPGGLLVGLALQYPFRYWLESWLLPPATVNASTVGWLLLLPLPFLIGGLILTLLFFGRRDALPSPRAQDTTGAAIGFVYALAAHTMVIGGVAGLIANRDVLRLYQWNIESTEWLLVIAEGVTRTFFEGLGSAWLIVIVLTLGGMLLGRWLLPLDPYGYAPTRSRDLFVPLAISLIFTSMILGILTQVIVLAPVDTSLANIARDNPGTQFPSLVPLSIGISWAIQLLAQVAALVWLWRVPVASIHRTGLRAAQLYYGIALTIAQVFIFIFVHIPKLPNFPAIWVLVASTGLGLAFAAMAQWKLQQAAAVRTPAQLKLTFWKALQTAFGIMIVIGFLGDLLFTRTSLNLALISVSMIPVQTQADAPWENIFASTLNTEPLVVVGYALITAAASLVILVPILFWATRRERELSAAPDIPTNSNRESVSSAP